MTSCWASSCCAWLSASHYELRRVSRRTSRTRRHTRFPRTLAERRHSLVPFSTRSPVRGDPLPRHNPPHSDTGRPGARFHSLALHGRRSQLRLRGPRFVLSKRCRAPFGRATTSLGGDRRSATGRAPTRVRRDLALALRAAYAARHRKPPHLGLGRRHRGVGALGWPRRAAAPAEDREPYAGWMHGRETARTAHAPVGRIPEMS
jgi:hypothetical protein